MRRGQTEVLAPAGSFESLQAAVGAGADGVYIGGSRFGARAYADNLDQGRMLEAIDYVHFHGVSLYMTVNTLMKEEELGELPGFLEPFYEQGLDGVIVQDLGALRVIRTYFPDLPVHASTQMTITGVYGAKILAELGVKRVVTARELSLEEIRRIRREVPIEIECFVHGALCYCYSGQCLLSSFIGGRSGNRGRCAQPCRLPYVVRDSGEETREAKKGRGGSGKKDARGCGMGNGNGQNTHGQGCGSRKKNGVEKKNMKGWEERYLLSMKDLCTLDLIPDLLEAGVSSLKIEGRMKSPRYTAGVVRVYRKYVDLFLNKGREGYDVDPADRQELLDLFDRGGFTQGYYRQHNGRDMLALREKPAFRQGNQRLFGQLDRLYVNEEKKQPVEGILTVEEGKNVCLQLKSEMGKRDGKESFEVTLWGPKAETAKRQPVSRQQLEKQIKKTGDMAFVWERLDICLKGQVFLPVQTLNELRRQGLKQLRQEMVEKYRRKQPKACKGGDQAAGAAKETGPEVCREETGKRDVSRMPGLSVLLAAEGGLPQVADVPEVSRIYMEADAGEPGRWEQWVQRCHDCKKSCYLAMPVIFRRQAERFFDNHLAILLQAGFDGILVRSLEEIQYLRDRGVKLPVFGDHNLYSFNSVSHKMLTGLGCQGTTFPLELNAREIGRLSGGERELVVYGFLPAMVSAQCVQKTISGCTKKPGRLMMRDRTGKELPVENHCAFCYNMIYNPSPLSLFDETGSIRRLAPEAVRLQFTGEEPGKIREIVTAWAKKLYTEDDLQSLSAVKEASARGEGAGDFTRGHFRRGVE